MYPKTMKAAVARQFGAPCATGNSNAIDPDQCRDELDA
jgi:hypothetical protein